ncbi:MAG: hemerythrin domain-containing protein [Sulfurimonas sp.]|uniref:hemerythrin domain-containing protein n=1 Tax=Sulfurimonas sp. TaxID=2022749 RepID=UPI00260BA15C|nr:hemerythrin domain-containing protein [Sulfurimonas sp.]MDD2652812.1 hemerythrin domain-containing protein [Sulfurimonas sp.]MDD3452123.1 hemerythrin domain-containing protein [Sulfurimonas sp.]
MSTIKGFLTEDHGRCDELFAKMEDEAAKSIENAKEAYEEFAKATERHFQMEERVMFLEFEQKTGMTQGPTAIMRHEHAQMRNLLAEMGKAMESKDKDKFFGNSETLMILMQQHNMKEEQMLYTMAQQHLSADADRIVDMMQSMIVE